MFRVFKTHNHTPYSAFVWNPVHALVSTSLFIDGYVRLLTVIDEVTRE